ncbi:MAG: hypothetical protein ACJ8AW_49880 [Rhodopila sp.]
MASNGHTRSALEKLDQALKDKPEVDGHIFSETAKELSQLRNELAERQRRDGATPNSRRQLEHVNAVISVVLGAHFPLGSVPWPEVEKARGWLAQLAEERIG